MIEQIYIILPVHNRREITRKFLISLNQQIFKSWHLILIDDGSTDNTGAMCRELIPTSTILKGNGDLWWGGSLQLGIDYLKKQNTDNDSQILFVNDDTELDKNFLQNGYNLIKDSKKTLLLAIGKDKEKKTIIESGSRIIWPLFKIKAVSHNSEINCAPTRGLLLKWIDIKTIGDFIPHILPHYCSDYEFTIRALKNDFKIVTNNNFYLYADYSTTGFHEIQAKSAKNYLQKLFSKRSAKNPLTLTKFICLSAPRIYIIPAVLKVWLGAIAKFALFLIKGNHA